MNNRDLDELLRKARTPEPPADYWHELSRRIGMNLGRAPRVVRARPGWAPRLAWGFIVVAACLVTGFLVGHWRGKVETQMASSDRFLQNIKAVHEMMALFPNRVSAVVKDEQGLRLVLSENGSVPDSPPLFVELCDGRRCSALVTFSGQEVRIDGRKVTVLSDAKGGVILIGDGFLWSSGEPTRVAGGLQIQARELASFSGG